MSAEKIPAYSPTSGRTYDSWDDLLAEESNGFAAAVILTDGKKVWTRTVGPFETKLEAARKAATMRRRLRKQDRVLADGVSLVKVAVEPLWKDIL